MPGPDNMPTVDDLVTAVTTAEVHHNGLPATCEPWCQIGA